MQYKNLNTTFWIVTAKTIAFFQFKYDTTNELFWNLLNAINAGGFMSCVYSPEGEPLGKVFKANNKLKKDIESLNNKICNTDPNISNRKSINHLTEVLCDQEINDKFFFYWTSYSKTNKTLLWKTKAEIICDKFGFTKEDADKWYDENVGDFFETYDIYQYFEFKSGHPKKEERICRFCKKSMPETKFNGKAHIIPKNVGGTIRLRCLDECDKCNSFLGKEVEVHLCNWFDVRRVIFDIKKRSGGVPNSRGLNYEIKDSKINCILDTYVGNKLLSNEPVTLQGIYRSLSKMILEIVPDKYLPRLDKTRRWIMTGQPYTRHYPKIAQISNLPLSDPHITLFIRSDERDLDNSPLLFAIFHIFDMAFIYTVPFIDNRSFYTSSYIEKVNVEALKLLGLPTHWMWESYNSRERRLPHVLNFNNSSLLPNQNISFLKQPTPDQISKEILDRYNLWKIEGPKLWEKK